jgi:hypothetical protein
MMQRSAFAAIGLVALLSPALPAAVLRPSGESPPELIEPEEVEVIDPIVAADAFAGETIRDRETAMKLIQSRGKKVPQVGQMAPDFELKSPDGKQTIRLSSFRGQRPVVVIFGSHT